MPIHDWSRVEAGVFHHFYQAWMVAMGVALNRHLLPKRFYALVEQYTGKVEVDVLSLESRRKRTTHDTDDSAPFAGTATITATRPQVDTIEKASEAFYAFKQSTVVVRESRRDRVVAMIEVVSAGNKSSEFALERFVDKVANAQMAGIHVTIVDLHRPQAWDPPGIHDVVWRAIGQPGYDPPTGKTLTQVAYSGAPVPTAYVKPAAIGDTLTQLPLFLSETNFAELPLEAPYEQTYLGVPEVWRDVIEGREDL